MKYNFTIIKDEINGMDIVCLTQEGDNELFGFYKDSAGVCTTAPSIDEMKTKLRNYLNKIRNGGLV